MFEKCNPAFIFLGIIAILLMLANYMVRSEASYEAKNDHAWDLCVEASYEAKYDYAWDLWLEPVINMTMHGTSGWSQI